MKLLRLILRRRLAYELLAEHDREPMPMNEAMEKIAAYANANAQHRGVGHDRFTDAVRSKMGGYQ